MHEAGFFIQSTGNGSIEAHSRKISPLWNAPSSLLLMIEFIDGAPAYSSSLSSNIELSSAISLSRKKAHHLQRLVGKFLVFVSRKKRNAVMLIAFDTIQIALPSRMAAVCIALLKTAFPPLPLSRSSLSTDWTSIFPALITVSPALPIASQTAFMIIFRFILFPIVSSMISAHRASFSA